MPLLDGFQTQIHVFLAKANDCNAMQISDASLALDSRLQ